MIILVTVDVEGAHSQNPVEIFINGRINNEEYGLNKIMDLCEYFQIKASFFVDVYEYILHGTSVMKEIVKRIAKRRHDIQLHTHPAWPKDVRDTKDIQAWKMNNCLFDPKKSWMYQYDLKEQEKILIHGKTLLEEWSNSSIVAHRAGGYGANINTLTAVKQVGLKMDFSAFRGHPNCRLKTHANTVKRINGVLEVPTTGFYRPWLFKFPRISFKRKFIKTDIDWASLDELKFYYEEGKKNGLKLMVLFMHSYSFIKMGPYFDFFETDYNDIEKFEKFLEWALHKGASFMTINEFWNNCSSCPEKFQTRDYIPTYVKAQRT